MPTTGLEVLERLSESEYLKSCLISVGPTDRAYARDRNQPGPDFFKTGFRSSEI